MAAVGSIACARARALWLRSIHDTCTLYTRGAGTNSHGDAVTVPVVRAATVPCAVELRVAPPQVGAGGTPITATVPVLRLLPEQAIAAGDWAALDRGGWYRVVGVPPVPTRAVTRAVEVEPTTAPEGAP